MVQKICDNISCDCILVKSYQYVPKNIRELFKTFIPAIRLDNLNLLYSCLRYRIGESFNELVEIDELHDIALSYLYEKNYIEFFNIVSEIGMNKKIAQHVLRIPYSDVKNYRVNINIKQGLFEVYEKDKYSDNKIVKRIEFYWGDIIEITDYERYNVPFTKNFLNITYDRWLSDMLANKNPIEKWKVLWQNGYKYKWKNFP